VLTRPAGSLLTYLEQVPEPRGRKGRRHPLVAMLATVCCAVLSGFPGYVGIAQWIHAQRPELWHALGFTRRPPTWSCFRDLLMVLDPEELQAALLMWLREGLGLEIDDSELMLDGKTLRGTRERHQRALATLSILSHKTGSLISEHPIDPATNEAKTALKVLEALVLKGKLIVGDAAYCEREICQKIKDEEGDYLVLVKDNQPTLHKDAQQAFVVPRSFSPLQQASGV
jgi:hypothetical protein